MSAVNDFVPFCPTDTGTNLLSQADYLVDPQLAIGNQPGDARSKLVNKAMRQATYIASCLAQFLANTTGNNVLDDATPSEVITTMGLAFANPSGLIQAFGGATAPTGYLLCDGSAVSRTTHAGLFTAIGTAYGIGDGVTTFNLPDLRGQFLRGVSAGSGNDPDAAGRTATNGGNSGNLVGSVQADDFASHQHETDLTDATHANFGFGATSIPGLDNGGATRTGFGHLTQATGGNETRPKNVYVTYIIKT